jgi:hypothetical protein
MRSGVGSWTSATLYEEPVIAPEETDSTLVEPAD